MSRLYCLLCSRKDLEASIRSCLKKRRKSKENKKRRKLWSQSSTLMKNMGKRISMVRKERKSSSKMNSIWIRSRTKTKEKSSIWILWARRWGSRSQLRCPRLSGLRRSTYRSRLLSQSSIQTLLTTQTQMTSSTPNWRSTWKSCKATRPPHKHMPFPTRLSASKCVQIRKLKMSIGIPHIWRGIKETTKCSSTSLSSSMSGLRQISMTWMIPRT